MTNQNRRPFLGVSTATCQDTVDLGEYIMTPNDTPSSNVLYITLRPQSTTDEPSSGRHSFLLYLINTLWGNKHARELFGYLCTSGTIPSNKCGATGALA
jgi:hypothetical protein